MMPFFLARLGHFMSHTLFIADLHLESDREDISDLFYKFLKNEARDADALYILGDLFEVWFGDDNPSEYPAFVATQIKAVSDSGVPVYYIHGNRDFTIGRRYAKKSGMIILPEAKVIDLYGHPTLIMHGDSLCTLDVAYQKFRKKSRSWWWKSIMLSLPLSYRQKLARDVREKSKLKKQGADLTIMDVTQDEVELQMKKFGVDRLIHGHTHRPAIHKFSVNNQPLERIVLGDWYSQGSILKVTADHVDLQTQAFIA